MKNPLEFSSATVFNPGVIWKIVAAPFGNRLAIELRDAETKTTRFSVVNLDEKRTESEGIELEEKWWVALEGICDDLLIVSHFDHIQNPDQKSLIVYNYQSQKVAWWRNHFSFDGFSGDGITGSDLRNNHKRIRLVTKTGELVENQSLEDAQNFLILKPFQYDEGSAFLNTVKTFVSKKLGMDNVIFAEYAETGNLIIISVFLREPDLANYLIVFDHDGNLCMKETLGKELKGIASDTFFCVSGFLIFVKNRVELVCYKIV